MWPVGFHEAEKKSHPQLNKKEKSLIGEFDDASGPLESVAADEKCRSNGFNSDPSYQHRVGPTL